MNLLSAPSARALARRALSFINSSAWTMSARQFRFLQSLLERENNHHVLCNYNLRGKVCPRRGVTSL